MRSTSDATMRRRRADSSPTIANRGRGRYKCRPDARNATGGNVQRIADPKWEKLKNWLRDEVNAAERFIDRETLESVLDRMAEIEEASR